MLIRSLYQCIHCSVHKMCMQYITEYSFRAHIYSPSLVQLYVSKMKQCSLRSVRFFVNVQLLVLYVMKNK